MEGNDSAVFSELNTQSDSGHMKDIREIAFSYMMYKVGKCSLCYYIY